MTTSPSVDSDLAFDPKWGVESPSTTVFDFDYMGGRDQLLRLYDKGTRRQWIGSDRLDWSLEVDPDNPVGLPDELSPLYDTEWWRKWDDKQKAELRRHVEGWRFSQFMHGEQGALICTAKIVQTVPDIDSKFYAATQVIDEARHVEVYSRYVNDKLQISYPLNKDLKALLDDVISDSRWDMTYLGMQVLIEGLALAAFGIIRNNATEPLAKALNAYVMQDEARHVMFGRLALRDYYPQLTQAERDERETFCVEACYLMRDRFLGQEVFERLDLPQELDDLRRGQRDLAPVPQLPVHADRAHLARHRPVGADPAQGLRRHGCDRLRRDRHRRRDGRGRAGGRGERRGPRRPHDPREGGGRRGRGLIAGALAGAAQLSASRAPLGSAGSVRWCRGSRATTSPCRRRPPRRRWRPASRSGCPGRRRP